ncbi:lytic transglycosylase domain-containing protein [Sphingomonas sp. Tas61C01]|uniref:lytic transglycosylase domain-containing protein n=1 Tax=Sphingomonas sp. Tas61C01 TaxID=3458297 RepID=UPI00403E3F60
MSAFTLFLISSPALAEQIPAPAEAPVENSVDEGILAPLAFKLVEHRTAGPAPVLPVRQSRLAIARTTLRAPWTNQARTHVLALIRTAEMRHALPLGLLEALVEVESAFQPGAISRAGAMGLSQLMPATARALGVLNPFDARANVDGGARYLRAMLDRFGSIKLALAAYNAGPGAVLRSRGVPANSETPAYVAKVLAAWSFGGVR